MVNTIKIPADKKLLPFQIETVRKSIEFLQNKNESNGVYIANEQGLVLRSLTVIQEGGNFTEIVPDDQPTLAEWATQRYALGLFIFDKCSMEFQKKV